jgi:hypothetical protein
MQPAADMTLEEARAEVTRLRTLVCWHRGQTYQQMCWQNDRRLWEEALGEPDPQRRNLPPWDERMTQCVAYWKSREDAPPRQAYVTLTFGDGHRATLPANAPLYLQGSDRTVAAVDVRPDSLLATGERVAHVRHETGLLRLLAEEDVASGRDVAWRLLPTPPPGAYRDWFHRFYTLEAVCLSRHGLEPLGLFRDGDGRLWAVPLTQVGAGKEFTPR